MEPSDRLTELHRAISHLQRKDKFSFQDAQDLQKMRQEIRDIELEMYGPAQPAKREFAKFRPIEETLAEIRETFKRNGTL